MFLDPYSYDRLAKIRQQEYQNEAQHHRLVSQLQTGSRVSKREKLINQFQAMWQSRITRSNGTQAIASIQPEQDILCCATA